MELSLKGRKVFRSVGEERESKMKSLCAPALDTERIFFEDLRRFGRSEKEIFEALDYAKTLDFSKSSLRASYLSHPIRVADFLLRLNPSIGTEALVTALLHNVPETTSVSLVEIEKKFGPKVSSGIGVLLVDRKVPFASIQEDYYAGLESAGEGTMLIKLLDKMDNLFVLCLNPDDKVRQEYIAEIRKQLLPFARRYVASLGAYLNELLGDASCMGFSRELKDQLETYQQHQKTGAVS